MWRCFASVLHSGRDSNPAWLPVKALFLAELSLSADRCTRLPRCCIRFLPTAPRSIRRSQCGYRPRPARQSLSKPSAVNRLVFKERWLSPDSANTSGLASIKACLWIICKYPCGYFLWAKKSPLNGGPRYSGSAVVMVQLQLPGIPGQQHPGVYDDAVQLSPLDVIRRESFVIGNHPEHLG